MPVIIISALSSLIFLQLLVIRDINTRKKKRLNVFTTLWRPIMMRVVYSDKAFDLPVLERRDHIYFIDEWNHIYSLIKGKARTRLIQIFVKLNIEPSARKLINKRNIYNKLIGVITIGNMGDEKDWDLIRSLTTHKNPIISLAALKGLIHIDPQRAVVDAIILISHNHFWSTVHVANILKEVGPTILSKPLAHAATQVQDHDTPYLLRYFNYIHTSKATPALNKIMHQEIDDRVISSCLQAMDDKKLLHWVREYVSYSRWHVRMHAASALGRMGTKKDIKQLASLLADDHWWVRYRAAQAIARLLPLNFKELMTIRDAQTDRYAKDIMSQVIFEERFI